jgi:hypothetical protein
MVGAVEGVTWAGAASGAPTKNEADGGFVAVIRGRKAGGSEDPPLLGGAELVEVGDLDYVGGVAAAG